MWRLLLWLQDQLQICDECDRGYHFKCCDPEITDTPEGMTAERSVTGGGECCLLACFMSQQHASVSQGGVCLDSCTCCHAETEVALTLTSLLLQQACDEWHEAYLATVQLNNACAGSWQRPSGFTFSCVIWAEWHLNPSMDSSPELLLAVNWYSGGLSFKIIWSVSLSAKQYWREAGSPEEVLGWAFILIIFQPASLYLWKNVAKWLNRFRSKTKTGSRLRGRNWLLNSPTYYDFLLFHSLKSETGIHSNGSVDLRCLQWWTPAVNKSCLQW